MTNGLDTQKAGELCGEVLRESYAACGGYDCQLTDGR
jgi:hypothetical protein